MFTVIFSDDGYQFNATSDGARNMLKGATITKKYVRGPLSIIECTNPWTTSDGYSGVDTYMITCTSADVMNELVQSWSKQF